VSGGGAGYSAVHPLIVGETHIWHATPSFTVAWRGSRVGCPARSSVALLAGHLVPGEGKHVGHVVIGMDPHKRSATIEIIDDRGKVLCGGRFGTDLRITDRDCTAPWECTHRGQLYADPGRLFTSATCLHALCSAGRWRFSGKLSSGRTRWSRIVRRLAVRQARLGADVKLVSQAHARGCLPVVVLLICPGWHHRAALLVPVGCTQIVRKQRAPAGARARPCTAVRAWLSACAGPPGSHTQRLPLPDTGLQVRPGIGAAQHGNFVPQARATQCPWSR
jgi:hypothetical protein